ncbi:hypothetical protein T4C_10890 [Trichinella pseudospiralis]|uniref:Uncharacterized protein n=1 Tax=Trichinella pseudospiralis TaxID=6337 RepID=A0A0V1IIA4_TRIPS|nr:hypothetical protein T4C_10890 [Trichinella pseudospiralis]
MHPECFLRYIADISWNGVRNNNDEIPLCISSGKYISRGSKSYPPILQGRQILLILLKKYMPSEMLRISL